MGCFSFICDECGEPVNSNSFDGELVELFLLKKGKVIQLNDETAQLDIFNTNKGE